MLQALKKHLDRWFVPPSSGVHFDVADGLRGLAILMVVICHGIYANPNGPPILLKVVKFAGIGAQGVPVFFVLSGFLLSLPFFRNREKDPSHWYHNGFATRRVLKIIPPFYLVIVVLALINYFRYNDPQYFTLGAAWGTGIAHFVWFPKPFNGSFWSLWVEIGFYVVLPFLFLLIPGRNAKATGWIIFVLLIVVSCVSRLVFWGGSTDLRDWHFVTSRFPCSLDFFAWGMLFASFYLPRAQDKERWRHLGSLGYLGLILLFIGGVVIFWYEVNARPGTSPGRLEVELRHLLPALGAFFILFFVFDSGCFGARIFSSATMRFIGAVSYEWFLIHQPMQIGWRTFLSGSRGSFPRYIFIVISSSLLSLAVAAVIYHAFSLPIMKWGREKLRRTP